MDRYRWTEARRRIANGAHPAPITGEYPPRVSSFREVSPRCGFQHGRVCRGTGDARGIVAQAAIGGDGAECASRFYESAHGAVRHARSAELSRNRALFSTGTE